MIINQLQTTDFQSVEKKVERSVTISKKSIPFQGLKCTCLFKAKKFGHELKIKIMPLGILGGTLLASALQAIFGIGSQMAANKYNSPKAQKKRLQAAGLPLSYMYRGNVATQSQVPQLSIDPHLGTLAQIQGKSQKAAARKTNAEAENTERENQIKDMMSGIKQPDGTELNNRATQMIAERDAKRADAFIKTYESELRKIELDVERDAFSKGTPQAMKEEALKKARQQVKNLIAQAGLMKQLGDIRSLEQKLNSELSDDLENMPDFISALLKILLIATKRK